MILRTVIFSTFLMGSYLLNAASVSEVKEFNLAQIKEVEIESMDGLVHIVSTQANKITFQIEKVNFEKECRLKWEEDKTSVELKVWKEKKGFTSDCKVNIKVEIPKSMNADVDLGNGDIKIEGIEGEIQYNLGNGNFMASGKISKLEGKTGNGKTIVSGLMGSVDLKKGNGEIELEYTQAPKKTDLKIEAGRSDIIVKLPKDAKVLTKSTLGFGEIKNDFKDASSEGLLIEVKAGMGSLQVKKI